jgi:hypothetical protein
MAGLLELRMNHSVGSGVLSSRARPLRKRPDGSRIGARSSPARLGMVKRLQTCGKFDRVRQKKGSRAVVYSVSTRIMTDTQRSGQVADSSLFAGLVKTGALVGALTWAFVVLSFIVAFNGPGVTAPGLLAFLLGTPVFFIFVLPALLFSFLGGHSGAKAGACFLIGGLLVVAVVFAGPILRMIS